MSRTEIVAYTSKEDADKLAVARSEDHKVMVIGPTDQVGLARDFEDGKVLRSGPDTDFWVVIATKDAIAGPL